MEDRTLGWVKAGLDARLTTSAFTVLMAMVLVARPGAQGPVCDVRQRALARRAGVCTTTLARCTAELEQKGLIARRPPRPGSVWAGNVYVLLEDVSKPGSAPESETDGPPEGVPNPGSVPKSEAGGPPEGVPKPGGVSESETGDLPPLVSIPAIGPGSEPNGPPPIGSKTGPPIPIRTLDPELHNTTTAAAAAVSEKKKRSRRRPDRSRPPWRTCAGCTRPRSAR